MNEHRTPEQSEALKLARKWEAAATACSVSAVLILPLNGPLSEYLSPQLGLSEAILRAAFVFLPIIWIGATAYCSSRAQELRCVAKGQRHWRQAKKEAAEELARAEAYLAIKKR